VTEFSPPPAVAARRFSFVGSDVVKPSGPGPTAGFLFVGQRKGSEKVALSAALGISVAGFL